MAKRSPTPVQFVDEVRSVEICGQRVIVALGSCGAEIRLTLDSRSLMMLAQRAERAALEVFTANQQSCEVISFANARRA